MKQLHPKLGRELKRIQDQLNSWMMRAYEPWIRRQRNKYPERYVSVQGGDIVGPNKLAIYLVYQPQGLSESTFGAMQHFHKQGYAVLLVSNSPLVAEDAARARPHCWAVMQRRNFGYDFGGYQDAIRHIWASGLRPQALVIINDSIWFPLRSNCDLLQRLESTPSAFTGAFQLEPTRKRHATGKKRPFMGSFFWHFKPSALEATAFRTFWSNYKATSSKYATIRQGERRFTHHMQDGGVPCEGIYSRQQFDAWLEGLNPMRLQQALADLCTVDAGLQQQQAALVRADRLEGDWQTQAMRLAKDITRSQNIMATAPLFMVRDLGLPFFKKAMELTNALALHRLLTAAEREPGIVDNPAVLNEMRERLTRR